MMISEITKIARDMPELLGFQHFEVDLRVWEFAQEQALSVFPEDEDELIDPKLLVCPTSARLPAPQMTICTGESIFCFQATEAKDGTIVVGLKKPDCSAFSLLGGIIPGECPTVKENHDDFLGANRCYDILHILSYVLSLINEPRVLAHSPAGTRQMRRSAHRAMGFAVDAWTRVSWDLSKETAAKVSRDPGFHKVPLHWRRGHFRRAQEHFRGAIQRPDAFREEDRCGWWQWIDGQWVGHPAFGIKKSVHAPRLSGPDIARRRVA